MERILIAWNLYKTGRITEPQLDTLLALQHAINHISELTGL